MEIRSVGLPTPSLIASAFPSIDFADAFRADLPAGMPQEPDTLVRIFFGSAPSWIMWLMRLRNALVRPFGIGTDFGEAAIRSGGPLRPGECVGPFRVFVVENGEALMGLDDRHLDFRVSVLVRAGTVTVTTIVRRHNWFGRAYFAIVKPFHRLVVPALMRHGLRQWGRGGVKG